MVTSLQEDQCLASCLMLKNAAQREDVNPFDVICNVTCCSHIVVAAVVVHHRKRFVLHTYAEPNKISIGFVCLCRFEKCVSSRDLF